MKRYTICLTLILILTSSISLFAQFAGGSGTARDPWKVATAEQLNNVRSHLNASFIQTADINLDAKPWNQGEGWKPIGSHRSRFTGNYNGAGFVIKGLKINRPDGDAQGLFGCLEGSVQSLGLKNFNIQGDSGAGGLGRRTSDMVHPYSHNTYLGWNREIWAPDTGHKINGEHPC